MRSLRINLVSHETQRDPALLFMLSLTLEQFFDVCSSVSEYLRFFAESEKVSNVSIWTCLSSKKTLTVEVGVSRAVQEVERQPLRNDMLTIAEHFFEACVHREGFEFLALLK